MAARHKPQPAGPKALSGSDEAKRKSALILEALCGLRPTQSAADEMGVALVRYYVLETRCLQAMIEALEPRARGRKRDVEQEMAKLHEENARLEREVMRVQALYRVTQRAVGVREEKRPPARKKLGAKKSTKKTRRVRKKSRGERVLEALRERENQPSAKASTPAPSTMPANTSAAQGGA